MSKSMNVNLYISLFFGSLIISAITSAKYVESRDPVELMSSSGFIVGMAVAVLSLVLWRKESSLAAIESNECKDNSQSPQNIVNDLKKALEELEGKSTGLNRSEWMNELKSIEAQYIFPFHEVKDLLIYDMDVHAKADYLLGFAYGERMLNRAYSYCADGFSEDALPLICMARESFEKQCLSKN